MLATTLLAMLVRSDAAEPAAAGCPPELAALATCYAGQDSNGAFYSIAVPKRWNGSLVVYAHGGPGFSTSAEGPAADAGRWAVMVEKGYAWIGSSYRRGGYGVRMAAADTENARRLFVEEFGRPARTFLHGQSWGGDVAAKAAEAAVIEDARGGLSALLDSPTE